MYIHKWNPMFKPTDVTPESSMNKLKPTCNSDEGWWNLRPIKLHTVSGHMVGSGEKGKDSEFLEGSPKSRW